MKVYNMRKYLIVGILALVGNIFMTSCHEDMENYSSLEEAKKVQFAQNFEKFYGKISPTQDWGFDNASAATSRAMTRSTGDNSCGTCIKPDMTNYPSANAPADITAQERAYVKNWFETHPGFTSGLNISNFYVQHVWGLASKPYKVWYNHYDQNYMNNHPGASSNYFRDDYYDNGTIDYLSVGDGKNYTHLNDFNSNNAGTQWGTIYMENSSALSFKYHCSWSSEEFTYFKCAEINVPGVGKGYYVGMCMAGYKKDNGDRYINKDSLDLQYADDWIIKVIPGNGSSVVNTKTSKVLKKKDVLVHKWVFCEDLGSSSSNKDYDYNDLVFDAKIIDEYKVLRDADGNETAYTDDPSHSYYAEVTPLAAGGELTIKFDKISNTVHGMFANGIANNVLINTCRADQSIAASHQERLLAQTKKYEFASAADANINNIAVVVRTQTAAYALSAYKGEAPHKICVPAGTRWAYERTDIKDAYRGFEAYVGGGSEPWSTTGVEDNLYPLDGVAYEMKNDQTGTSSYEELSSSSTTQYSYTLEDSANEHKLWDSEMDFTWSNGQSIEISPAALTNANIANGTVIRIYGVANGSFGVKAIYLDSQSWDNIDLGDENWINSYNNTVDKCNYSASSVNGCIRLVLNPTTAANFKTKGMRIYGDNFKALCVTYDNSNTVTNTTPSTPSSGGTEIWSGSKSIGFNLELLISKDKFANATSTSVIRFHGTDNGGHKQIWLKTEGWQDIVCAYASNDWPSSNYVDLTIGDYLSTIKSNNITIQGAGVTITKIELIP